MPIARFQMPDGRVARFEVPEGTTPQRAQSMMEAHFAQPTPASSPIDDRSFVDNARAGMGSAFADLGLGAKQRLDDAAAYLESKFGGQSINKALGMQNAADIQKQTQAAVDEKRRLDAPLMETAGGKAGAIVGKALPAIGAALIPGGQTLAGSMAAGGGLGLIEPTATGESAVGNALAGTMGGAAGYGVGKGLGYLASKVGQSNAASKGANALRDALAKDSMAAGYTIPPTQTNPTMLNRTLEGLAGKISTGQSASIKNQSVTNSLAAKALGLPEDTKITKDVLSGIRSEAGQAYDAVKGAGTIQADPQYAEALSGITQKFQGASKDFPELAKTDISDIVASIDKPSFGADSAVDAIKILRERASNAYAKGDKSVGQAYRSASDAMESLIERNLQAAGEPARDLLNAFRDARQLIAKTYTVEGALNNSTGNVQARKLATQLAKAKPISGDLRAIAQFGQAFPKAADEVTSSMPGISPLDFFGAGGLTAATGNPLAMLAVGARPAARSIILSRPYQNALATPSYGGNMLLNLLANDPARLSMQAIGEMQRSPQLAK